MPALDGLARLGEERAGSGAIAGGPLRVRERRQDARLVPQGGAPRARERERGLERTRGGGDVAGGELGGAEKRGGLDPGERTAALFGQLSGPAAVSERAGEIAPQPQHLAQESVRPAQGFESPVLLVGEERFQDRLSFGRVPLVNARQRPPDATEGRCGGTPDRLPQPVKPGELGQGSLGNGARGLEAADRQLRVRQHRVHLKRERRVVGSLGELGGSLRTGEVLRYVAREPAQASVGGEQERVTSRIPQSLGDRAGLLEEVLGLPLFDARDAADLE